ncbi:hypothetical protein KDJ56_09430 [Brevibacillus composti]|uniref:Uncharacterized protein n=1 Tax=Brevibacillus composti TaxID=2796470 RepID=A0A7T5JQC7_9BACL|nr:hypothetical protein [Brevibacillus composti]QQE76112.1 hypothetical protein JD108_09735 [Brevibacillus composti]QUO43141.1 hypothetical protein KDJ56_09430 [Brevibacillus composti]
MVSKNPERGQIGSGLGGFVLSVRTIGLAGLRLHLCRFPLTALFVKIDIFIFGHGFPPARDFSGLPDYFSVCTCGSDDIFHLGGAC